MAAPAPICVARIGAPHGVRGEVRLVSYTADPAAVKDYGTLASEDGTTRIEIEALRPAKGHFVARLVGISDRDAAERLTGLALFVPRERLPPPEPDEFYHADLIGLAALTADGTAFGTITAVHDFGAGAVLELAPRAGGATTLLPFSAAFVPEVDIAHGRVTVVPPEEPPEELR